MKELNFMKSIERLVYPKPFQQMQELETHYDLIEYCGSETIFMLGDEKTYYMLLTVEEGVCEIIDLASIDGIDRRDVLNLITSFKDLELRLGIESIETTMRFTSYKLKGIIESLGYEIVSKESYYDEDFKEHMFDLVFMNVK